MRERSETQVKCKELFDKLMAKAITPEEFDKEIEALKEPEIPIPPQYQKTADMFKGKVVRRSDWDGEEI